MKAKQHIKSKQTDSWRLHVCRPPKDMCWVWILFDYNDHHKQWGNVGGDEDEMSSCWSIMKSCGRFLLHLVFDFFLLCWRMINKNKSTNEALKNQGKTSFRNNNISLYFVHYFNKYMRYSACNESIIMYEIVGFLSFIMWKNI